MLSPGQRGLTPLGIHLKGTKVLLPRSALQDVDFKLVIKKPRTQKESLTLPPFLPPRGRREGLLREEVFGGSPEPRLDEVCWVRGRGAGPRELGRAPGAGAPFPTAARI